MHPVAFLRQACRASADVQKALNVLELPRFSEISVFAKPDIDVDWNPRPDAPDADWQYWNLVGAVARLEPLMHASSSHVVRYYTGLCIDMLAEAWCSGRPCVDEARLLFYGNVNDITCVLPFCNFWQQSSRVTHPIVHILNKALPIRCQVRNLRKVIEQYTNKYPGIGLLLLKIAKISILGNYPHCAVRPGFAERIGIYRDLGSAPHVLYFYAIKEFIVHMMHTTPALHDILCRTYRWNIFETNIGDVMDNVRRQFRNTEGWHRRVSDDLMTASKQQLKYVYCVGRESFDYAVAKTMSQKLPPRLAAVADVLGKAALHGRRDSRRWIRELGVTCREKSQLAAARHMHASTNGCRVAVDKKTLPQSDAVLLYYDALYHEMSIVLYALPSHWADKQREALVKKYGTFSRRFTTFCICLRCQKFKGILSDRGNANAYAIGQQGVVLSCQDDLMYCRNTADGCGTVALPTIDMFGCILQFYKHLLILCPSCGSPTYYSGQKYGRGGVFTCGRCPKAPVKDATCSFCSLRIAGTVKTFTTAEGRSVAFCHKCKKHWMCDGLVWEAFQTGILEDWDECRM